MKRGRSNRGNQGIPGQFRGGSPRGNRGRGRGRGQGRGRGDYGGPGGYIPAAETDFVLQMWPESNPYSSPRGRGRGRGIGSHFSPANTPRGSGSGSNTPRGRGRGRGRGFGGDRGGGRGGGWKGRSDVPLSRILNEERPYLKPIVFVPSTQARFLFQEEEELIQPIVEEVGDEEQAHVPTADRVARVFSGNFKPSIENEDSDGSDQEQLEEIDFADLGTFREAVEKSAAEGTLASTQIETEVEEKFTGTYQTTQSTSTTVQMETETTTFSSHSKTVVNMNVDEPAPEALAVAEMSLSEPQRVDETSPTTQTSQTATSPTVVPEDPIPGFVIDTTPATRPEDIHTGAKPTVPTHASTVNTPPVIDGDEEVIVYVAPHPRSGRITPAPVTDNNDIQPTLSNLSILTGRPIGSSIPEAGPAPILDSISFSTLGQTASSSRSTADGSFAHNEEVPTGITDSPNVPDTQPEAGPSHSHTHTHTRKPPVFVANQHTPVKLKMRQRGKWAAKQRQQRKGRSLFASRGADVSEAQLRDWKVDPRGDERRRGDSDVDWGDEDDEIEEREGEEDEEVRAVVKDGVTSLRVVSVSKEKGKAKESTGAEGMDVDPELEMDIEAMKRFAAGMGGPDAGRFVTMDDIEVEKRIQEEDEESDDGTEDDDDDEDDEDEEDEEVEEILEMEEELLVAEAGGLSLEDEDEDGLEDDEESDNDDEQSPKSSFQARLDRIRKASRQNGKGKGKAVLNDDFSDDDDDDWLRNRSWAEEDDEFIAHIHDIIDENEDIMFGRDRVGKKKLFRAIQDGDFGDVDGFMDVGKPARKRKDKAKDLPPDLAELWERDRKKKAIRKQERELLKLQAAADPLAPKKGGKKGRKAMLAAAKLDPTITVVPNRVIDMTTLVQQIRRFLDDLDGPLSMSLPPCNKHTRKMIHDLANAFNLKSISKGRGDARYTTLTKTTRSGIQINEKKVARIVRRGGGVDFVGGAGDGWERGGKKGGARMPKHREGEEIGKAAPKINEGNVGFRMLASMGWSEGDRIGLSGGLRDPLTAVIKHTKLGLGATL